MTPTQPLDVTVRRLREEGRKRAVIGQWHVTIGATYAVFEHADDRAARLAPTDKAAK